MPKAIAFSMDLFGFLKHSLKRLLRSGLLLSPTTGSDKKNYILPQSVFVWLCMMSKYAANQEIMLYKPHSITYTSFTKLY